MNKRIKVTLILLLLSPMVLIAYPGAFWSTNLSPESYSKNIESHNLSLSLGDSQEVTFYGNTNKNLAFKLFDLSNGVEISSALGCSRFLSSSSSKALYSSLINYKKQPGYLLYLKTKNSIDSKFKNLFFYLDKAGRLFLADYPFTNSKNKSPSKKQISLILKQSKLCGNYGRTSFIKIKEVLSKNNIKKKVAISILKEISLLTKSPLDVQYLNNNSKIKITANIVGHYNLLIGQILGQDLYNPKTQIEWLSNYSIKINDTEQKQDYPTIPPTQIPSPSATDIAINTPTQTVIATQTSTQTRTPISTPSKTPINTPTATPTKTPTATPTKTPTATPTSTPLQQLQFSITSNNQNLINLPSLNWGALEQDPNCGSRASKVIQIRNLDTRTLSFSWLFTDTNWEIASNGFSSNTSGYSLLAGANGTITLSYSRCLEGLKNSLLTLRIKDPFNTSYLTQNININLSAESVAKADVKFIRSSDGNPNLIESNNPDKPIGLGFATVGADQKLSLKLVNSRSHEVVLSAPSLPSGIVSVTFPSSLAAQSSQIVDFIWQNPQETDDSFYDGLPALVGNLLFTASPKDFPSLATSYNFKILGSIDHGDEKIEDSFKIFVEDYGKGHLIFPVDSQQFSFGDIGLNQSKDFQPYSFRNSSRSTARVVIDSIDKSDNFGVRVDNTNCINCNYFTSTGGVPIPLTFDIKASQLGSFETKLKGYAGFLTDTNSQIPINLSWKVSVKNLDTNPQFNFSYPDFFDGLLRGELRAEGSCSMYEDLFVNQFAFYAPVNIACNNNRFSYSSSLWDRANLNPSNRIDSDVARLSDYLQIVTKAENSTAQTIQIKENYNRRPFLKDFPQGVSFETNNSDIPVRSLSQRTLVIYNTNVTSAKEVADYYADQRNIAATNLCGVQMVPGLYASEEEYRGAKKQILENCVCAIAQQYNSSINCSTTTGPELQLAAKIDHLVFIRGWPARISFNSEEPSLDAFMSNNLFAHADNRPGPYQLSWGRIDGVTKESAKVLVDRAIEAELVGMVGKIATEYNPLLYAAKYGSSPKEKCRANQDGSGAWDYLNCDVNFEKAGLVPGSVGSSSTSIVPSINLFLGTNPWPNNQHPFNSFWETLLKWRKDPATCTPLCKDLPIEKQPACRQQSKDYFKMLDTNCVGGSVGFMGQQIRSYPVNNFGFVPQGYDSAYGNGASETSATNLINTSGDMSNPDFYIRLGMNDVVTNPICKDGSGVNINCSERIPLLIARYYKPLVQQISNNLGSLNLTLKFQLRNRNPEGGKFSIVVSPVNNDSGAQYFSSLKGEVDLSTVRSNWQEFSFPLNWNNLPANRKIDFLYVDWNSPITNRGSIEVDNLRIEDNRGTNLLTAKQTSFSEEQDFLSFGSWATVAIERLGATAWWGSSSHYRTDGFAFSNHENLFNTLISGGTLGEALVSAGRPDSGLIYGDPLLNIAGARIDIKNTRLRLLQPLNLSEETLTVDPQENSKIKRNLIRGAKNSALDDPIQILAFNGKGNDSNLTWKIDVCEEDRDFRFCDTENNWQTVKSGIGAIRQLTSIGFNLKNFISDLSKSKSLNFKISLNTGNNPEIRNYFLVRYQP